MATLVVMPCRRDTKTVANVLLENGQTEKREVDRCVIVTTIVMIVVTPMDMINPTCWHACLRRR